MAGGPPAGRGPIMPIGGLSPGKRVGSGAAAGFGPGAAPAAGGICACAAPNRVSVTAPQRAVSKFVFMLSPACLKSLLIVMLRQRTAQPTSVNSCQRQRPSSGPAALHVARSVYATSSNRRRQSFDWLLCISRRCAGISDDRGWRLLHQYVLCMDRISRAECHPVQKS